MSGRLGQGLHSLQCFYLGAAKRAVAVQPVPGEQPKRKTATV